MRDPLALAILEIQRLLIENERLRGVIERLEIEKHNLAEKLAGRDGAR